MKAWSQDSPLALLVVACLGWEKSCLGIHPKHFSGPHLTTSGRYLSPAFRIATLPLADRSRGIRKPFHRIRTPDAPSLLVVSQRMPDASPDVPPHLSTAALGPTPATATRPRSLLSCVVPSEISCLDSNPLPCLRGVSAPISPLVVKTGALSQIHLHHTASHGRRLCAPLDEAEERQGPCSDACRSQTTADRRDRVQRRECLR